jgi:hypothetical protein
VTSPAAFAGLLALLLVAGCSTHPYRESGQDAAAKTFAVAPAVAAIYLYFPGKRPIIDKHLQVGMPATLNGRAIGTIYSGTYRLLVVPPGEHDLWVGWDPATSWLRLPLNYAPRFDHVHVRVQPGQALFVRTDFSKNQSGAIEPSRAMTEIRTCCVLIEQQDANGRLFP